MKNLKAPAIQLVAEEVEGQMFMADMPEPLTVDQIELLNQDTPVQVDPITPTPTPAPVKPAGKPVASDKTVIKNLRAEVRKITEELNAVHAELDIQEQKNIILFNQMKEMRNLEVELESKQGMAQEILYNGITNTLNAFNAILRK